MQPKKPSQESPNVEHETFSLPGEDDQRQKSDAVPEVKPAPDRTPESAEAAPDGNERYLSDPERPSSANATQTQAPSLPQPNNQASGQAPPVQTDDDQIKSDDTPLIADDVDVIEKEWVDKAKQIIERTKDHPYRQEQEVERLQQSYLKKRYGKDVSSANQN